MKEKVKTETFEYLAREYGSIINSIDFSHDRDVTSDGKQVTLSHGSELKPLSITSLENLSSQ